MNLIHGPLLISLYNNNKLFNYNKRLKYLISDLNKFILLTINFKRLYNNYKKIIKSRKFRISINYYEYLI